MEFKAPYLPYDVLRQRVEAFLSEYHPDETIPVPIEEIVEFKFDMDIVPVPGLQDGYDTVAYITRDLSEIRVDEYVLAHREARYRFSLAHELGHRVLHSELIAQIDFHDIESWKNAVQHSIPEREYGYLEFHAHSFAGLVLVPSDPLRASFDRCMKLCRQNGIDFSQSPDAAKSIVEDFIAREFKVSSAVVHRRLEFDELWEEKS